jgi:hypothetical protein
MLEVLLSHLPTSNGLESLVENNRTNKEFGQGRKEFEI